MTGAAGKPVWVMSAPGADIECRVAPGCHGVALTVDQGGETLARESHADHSTAYERARHLRAEYDEAVSRMQGEPYLRGRACIARPWRLSDAAPVARHANNPAIGRNLRDGFPYPYTIEDARAFIEAARRLEPLCRFAIIVDGEAAGSIGFTLHPNVERVSAEIGYWLGEACWGRGITTDAVQLVTRYAIQTHQLTRVYAVPYEWNPASFRVLEKAGFVLEARLRRSAIKDGQILDQMLYAYCVAEAGKPDTVIAEPGHSRRPLPGDQLPPPSSG